MNIDPLLPWIISVALLTVRLTFALALSPVFSSYGVPPFVRIALTLALAVLTFAYQKPSPAAAAWIVQPATLIVPVLTEVFTGALLGLGVHIVLAALALAGRLMDVQIGFAIGSIFDPVTRTSSNVLGSLVSLLGITLFVVSDAHLELARLVARSVEVFPLGTLPPLNDPMQLLLAAGSMFTLGVAFSAPVAAALFLTDVVVGVASRNMPQVNVLVLAMPVKVIVGYGVLALVVRSWGSLLQQGLGSMAAVLEAR